MKVQVEDRRDDGGGMEGRKALSGPATIGRWHYRTVYR